MNEIIRLSEEINKRGYTIHQDLHSMDGQRIYKLIIRKEGQYITVSYATSLEEALRNALIRIIW